MKILIFHVEEKIVIHNPAELYRFKKAINELLFSGKFAFC